MTTKILVADDSKTIQKVIRIALSKFATTIETAGSYRDVMAQIAKNPPAVIIADCVLSGTNGPADFQKMSTQAGNIPVVMLVGSYEDFDEEAFKQVGYSIFVRKPFEAQDIVKAVNSVLSKPLTTKKQPTHSSPNTEEETKATKVLPPPPPTGFSRKIPEVTVPPPPQRRANSPAANETDCNRENGKLEAQIDPGFFKDSLHTIDDDIGGHYEDDPATYFGMDDEDTFKRDVPDEDDLSKVGHLIDENEHNLIKTTLETVKSPTNKPPAKEPLVKDAPLREQQVVATLSHELMDEIKATVPQMVRDEVERVVAEQVEVAVRKFLEAYCDKNVKSLVKEIITSEIRRLTDEKARHLIDGKP